MRILWMSVAPWCPTGYGVVTSNVVPRMKAAGYDVGIYCYYGLRGSDITWNDIPLFSNDASDYGIHMAQRVYDKFKADLLITLEDVWVYDHMGKNKVWMPYCPIDHDPIPPLVQFQLRSCRRPIAMSHYGEKELKRVGYNPWYVPHGVDTEIYKPDPEAGKRFRETQEWGDKFVVGTVATNKVERKNHVAMMSAFAIFHAAFPDSVFYCHTNPFDKEGRDLKGLAASLKIADAVHFPPPDTIIDGAQPQVMNAMYNSFDVFLLATKGEGFGIPIVESQSAGVPVIATAFTSCPELIGSGWPIREFTPEWTVQNSWWANADFHAVADALRKAYYAKRDGILDIRKREARLFAMKYDWNKVFETYWKPALKDMEEYVALGKYKQLYVQIHNQDTAKWADKKRPNLEADIWYNENRNEICKTMLNSHSCGKVLSMGCYGQFEEAFLKSIDATEKVGIDIIGPKMEGVTCLEGDATKVSYPDGYFDTILCRELIEHVPDEKALLKETYRLLKEGGKLLITTPNAMNTPPDGVEHVRAYSPGGFIKTLEEHGFTVLEKRGNVPNIFSSLLTNPSLLNEFKQLADRLKDDPNLYQIGSQIFVLAEKHGNNNNHQEVAVGADKTEAT